MIRRPPRSTLFSLHDALPISVGGGVRARGDQPRERVGCRGRVQVLPARRVRLRLPAVRYRTRVRDRKSTRLNSSHGYISYAVFCLKKKKKRTKTTKSHVQDNY